MAKAAKKRQDKPTPKKPQEKPLKVNMSFEELLNLAANTPKKKTSK